MSWDYSDDWSYQDVPDELFREALTYSLGTVGDAISARVAQCLTEAQELLGQAHTGAALTVAVTAIELLIRFMVVRPFVGGAVLFEELGDLLLDRLVRRSADDRELLPALLKRVDVDVTMLRTKTGKPLWEALQGLLKARNEFVHTGEPQTTATAAVALECATCLKDDVVGALADRLGFTLAATGKWSHIRSGLSERRFQAWDPISGKEWGAP